MLLERIRDEAHRFAINYHRKLREARTLESRLKNIEGVGASTVKALFAHFKSFDEIAKADKEKLLQVPRLNEKQADNIIAFFNNGDTV
jgi:excinuclease ABC subunit C